MQCTKWVCVLFWKQLLCGNEKRTNVIRSVHSTVGLFVCLLISHCMNRRRKYILVTSFLIKSYAPFQISSTYWIVTRNWVLVVLFQELIVLKLIDTYSYISVGTFTFYALECRNLRDSNILDLYVLNCLLGHVADSDRVVRSEICCFETGLRNEGEHICSPDRLT